MPTAQQPYKGSSRKLALCFDIGTTYSGVSYTILDPGLVPKIEAVTRYVGSGHAGGDSKVPTVVYYDSEGNLAAIGATTATSDVGGKADEEGWTRVEWFKLHLSPPNLLSYKMPRLPPGKTIVDVFADFMVYLLDCAKTYVQESRPNGKQFWDSFGDRIDYVLTHPNGWLPAQQTQMRKAAIQAGLIDSSLDEFDRLQFVTEGEASLHFCLESPNSAAVMSSGQGVLVVDAGGGTIDLSAYYMESTAPCTLDEVAASECLMQGSVFVSRRAETYFKEKLHGSAFASADDIKDIVNLFDKTSKINFKDPKDASFLKIGRPKDHDVKVGIRSGQLRIPGEEMSKLFEPSIQEIVDAVQKQIKMARVPIQAIFLVGGFAASHWLFARLKVLLEPLGLAFSRPDGQLNKAVADGGISFYLNHFVSGRVAKKTYGVIKRVVYDATKEDHNLRRDRIVRSHAGESLLDANWDRIIIKGTKASASTEYRRKYRSESPDTRSLGIITLALRYYAGSENPEPGWADDVDDFPLLCNIEADMSVLASSLQPSRTSSGTIFYRINYSVLLRFGLTELQAEVCWMEDGVEKKYVFTIASLLLRALLNSNPPIYRSKAAIKCD